MRYRYGVIVRLKKEVLDPAGQTILRAASLLQYEQVKEVRIGKFIDLTVSADDEAKAFEIVEKLTKDLLYNPVIEEYRIEYLGEEK